MTLARLVFPLALLVMVGALIFWRMGKSHQEQEPLETRMAMQGGIAPERGSARAGVPDYPVGTAREQALPALHRERVEVGDTLWEATTPEQAAWLNRHGFPTQGQLAAFNGARAAQLPADGRARSPVDVVVAESVAMSDPVAKARALALLRGASEAGSSYALQSLARIAHLSEHDPVKAEGYYRAALLRGDWLVGLREVPRLTPEQNYAADLRAARVLEQMNRTRRQRGLPALGVDLRPGAEEAFEVLSGGGAPAPQG
jgi:hypothetical protein